MSLDKAMLQCAGQDPARIVYQDQSGKLTAAELAGGAYMLSQLLAQKTQSNTVAICLPTIKEYPLAVFAVLLAGKTVVPINFLLQPRELIHVFKDSGADLVITSKVFEDKISRLGLNLLFVEDLKRPEGEAPQNPPQPKPAENPQEVAVLLYTSGTTALPKGVKLTHENFLAQRDSLGKAFDLENFHLLSPLPLFHTFALTVAVMLPAISKARSSLLPKFDPSDVLEALPKFGANTLVAVPSMYRMLGRAAKRAGHTAESLGLELAVAGGEKLAPEVRDEFETIFGLPLMEGYGLTEHSPVVAINTPSANKPGSIGKVLHEVEWRIIDGEGNELGAGEEGEIQLRSESVMAGYHNHEESPIDAEGWLTTGDLAVADEEGFIKITGRIKELIIAAGKNIHPAEIENVVAQHESVGECAVIAMPDKTRGEAPACFVVAKEGASIEAAELKDWLRDKLADYKMPRLIKVVGELPHGPTGKVFKRALKAMLEG